MKLFNNPLDSWGLRATDDNVPGSSFEAAGNLASSQFCFVTVNSDGQIAVTTEGALADGVLQDAPAAQGRVGNVHVARGYKCTVKAGGVVSKGDLVISDSTGRAISNASTADYVLGKALEAAGAADELITILFAPSTNV